MEAPGPYLECKEKGDQKAKYPETSTIHCSNVSKQQLIPCKYVEQLHDKYTFK